MIQPGAEMGTAKHSGEFDIRVGGGGVSWDGVASRGEQQYC